MCAVLNVVIHMMTPSYAKVASRRTRDAFLCLPRRFERARFKKKEDDLYQVKMSCPFKASSCYKRKGKKITICNFTLTLLSYIV